MDVLEDLGARPCRVRSLEELAQVAGLVIPGGESTSISIGLRSLSMAAAIRARGSTDMPVLGTCAGAIVMGSGVVDPPTNTQLVHLSLVDAVWERNAWGSHKFSRRSRLDSADRDLDGMPATLIRAPRCVLRDGSVDVLGEVDGDAALLEQGLHLACAFHPEIDGRPEVHQRLVDNVEVAKRRPPLGAALTH